MSVGLSVGVGVTSKVGDSLGTNEGGGKKVKVGSAGVGIVVGVGVGVSWTKGGRVGVPEASATRFVGVAGCAGDER